MKVISENSGFALLFDDQKELDFAVKELKAFAEVRRRSKKSWPALLGFCNQGEAARYMKKKLRWYRFKLGEAWSP